MSTTNAQSIYGVQGIAAASGSAFNATGYLVGVYGLGQWQIAATATQAIGVQAVIYNISTGTITDAWAARSQIQNLNASGTLTRAYGYAVNHADGFNAGTIGSLYGFIAYNGANSGTLTNQAGLTVAALSSATNNTHVLLGATSIPSGNFGIYQVSSVSTQVMHVLKGAASQSGDYLQLLNSGGSLVAKFNSDAAFVGNNGDGTYFNYRSSPNAKFGNTGNNTAHVIAAFKGMSGQTGALTQWQNNSSTVLTEINASGQFSVFAGFADAVNIALGTTTGTKIGTATSQKLAFFNSTPIVQFATTGETAGFTANASTAARVDSTFTGNVGSTAYTISDVVKCLKNFGFMAA